MARARPKPHDPWRDVPEEGRPTPQRLAMGDVRPTAFKEKGEGRVTGRVAYTRESDPVGRAEARGFLSQREAEALRKYEELTRIAIGSPYQRDSLNMTPIGHHGDPTAGYAAACKDRADAVFMLAADTARDVFYVAYLHEPIGKYDRGRAARVKLGAQILADWWKIPEYVSDDEGDTKCG